MIADASQLAGRCALVTGGSRGIGRAIALALVEAGADIAVNYLSRENEARQLSAQMESLGRSCIVVRADVSVAADVSRMIRRAEEELGPVSILVNNAGIARPQTLEEITEADWDEIMDINLKSVFLVTQAVLPGMRAAKEAGEISQWAQCGKLVAVFWIGWEGAPYSGPGSIGARNCSEHLPSFISPSSRIDFGVFGLFQGQTEPVGVSPLDVDHLLNGLDITKVNAVRNRLIMSRSDPNVGRKADIELQIYFRLFAKRGWFRVLNLTGTSILLVGNAVSAKVRSRLET